jgi:hypothetical protein
LSPFSISKRVGFAQLENRSRNKRDPRAKGKAEAQTPRLFLLNPKVWQRVTVSGGDRRRVSVSTCEASRRPTVPPKSAPIWPNSRLSLPAATVRVIRGLPWQDRGQTTGVWTGRAGSTILEVAAESPGKRPSSGQNGRFGDEVLGRRREPMLSAVVADELKSRRIRRGLAERAPCRQQRLNCAAGNATSDDHI